MKYQKCSQRICGVRTVVQRQNSRNFEDPSACFISRKNYFVKLVFWILTLVDLKRHTFAGILPVSRSEKETKEMKGKSMIEKSLMYWFTGTNVVE